jgi:hypothetical protein
VAKKTLNAGDDVVTLDRRSTERRKEEPAASNEPRRKLQRRRHIDPTTCERDYSDQEIEFMHAMDEYKRANGRMFPTCSEVLEVIRNLGYVRLTPEQQELFSGKSVALEVPVEA